MTTFIQRGERIPYTNAGSAIASGAAVEIQDSATAGYIGIAVTDIAASTGTGELAVKGVYAMTKTSGEAFTNGQLVYLNAGSLTGTSSGNCLAGRSVGAFASAATTANVNINVR